MFLLVQATSQLMYGRCEICMTYIPLNGNDKSIISFIGYGIAHSNNHTKQLHQNLHIRHVRLLRNYFIVVRCNNIELAP